MSARTVRVVALSAILAVYIAVWSAAMAALPLLLRGDAACDPERVERLQRGLAYAQGVHGTVLGLDDPERLARAAGNVEATRVALARCGVSS